MNSFVPVKFGKYYLLDRIATGGMAELFRAKLTGAEGFEKLIAIKKILHHLNTEDKLVSSFIDEAKLAAFLHHPNIVQIYDFGCLNETYFIAMEFLFGKDLRFTLKRSIERGMSISLEHTLYIVSQLLRGLDYAHTLHDFSGMPLCIIHRDIGPQNIFITYNGQVKIIDFGIAKAATQDTNTQVGTIKGKVSYMSPEQANGEVIDHRSDLFSVGIVLYELVTSKKMYEGDTFQILAKAREGIFKPAKEINGELPKGIYRILDKALEKDPANRYQTAEDMCKDIESFMLDQSMRAGQRELSVYMKALFHGESDESDIRHSFTAESLKGADESTLITEERDITRVDKKAKNQKRSFPLVRMAFYTLAFALTLSFYFYSQSDSGKVLINRGIDSLVGKSVVLKMTKDREAIQAGISSVEDKRYDDAVLIFEAILKVNPSSMSSISPYYSKALTSLASELMSSDIKKSRAYLEISYGLNPENSETCFLLGKLYTVLKQNRLAVAFYEKAAGLDPNNPDIYFNMGYNYAALDDYGRAKDMYKAVIDLAPTFLDQAYFNLALIQEKTGRHDEAVENMKMALKVNPKNRNAAKFLKKLNLSQNK
ncbi:MAG: protein kinase [Proteobacteria bacterium]|nr:protein kinase [Pseudomonadota bacterium]